MFLWLAFEAVLNNIKVRKIVPKTRIQILGFFSPGGLLNSCILKWGGLETSGPIAYVKYWKLGGHHFVVCDFCLEKGSNKNKPEHQPIDAQGFS